MKESNFEKWAQVFVLFLIGVGVCGWLGYSIWGVLNPQNETIKFEVVGIANNSPNASTLVAVHYDCIKYCSIHEEYPNECWKQCEKLGKEGC